MTLWHNADLLIAWPWWPTLLSKYQLLSVVSLCCHACMWKSGRMARTVGQLAAEVEGLRRYVYTVGIAVPVETLKG